MGGATKIKNFLFAIILKLNTKKFDVKDHVEQVLYVNKCDINYFVLSSSLIRIIDIEGKKCFFRECCLHSKKNKYIDDKLQLFYIIAARKNDVVNFSQQIPIQITFSKKEIEDFKNYIETCKNTKSFYKKVFRIPTYLSQIHFSIWENNNLIKASDLDSIGLVDYNNKYDNLLPLFLIYMRGVIGRYNSNSFVKENCYECDGVVKNLATIRLFKLFHVNYLVPDTKLVKLNVGNKSLYGTLSEQAEGIRAIDSLFGLTPSLQRVFSILYIMDSLCCQKDHYENNYNVVCKGTKPVSICAFDNDNPFTFFPTPNPTVGNRYTPIITNNSTLNLPFCDSTFINTFISISSKKMYNEIKPYLSCWQSIMLMIRFSRLIKVINKSIEKKECLLLKEDDWNEDTICKECSCKYGVTYSSLFANRINNMI